MRRALCVMFALLLLPTLWAAKPRFVTVGSDGNFHNADSIYRFSGTNFWYGPIIASEGRGGDRARLHRELDRLKQLGITNLRILSGADGDEGLPSHISPTLQKAPGVYNDTLLRGLDYLLAELEKRDMKAVIYLTNAWEWSGGYGTYLEWTGHDKAPVPDIDGYQTYVDYASQFVLDSVATRMAIDNARFIAGRTNTVTGKPYSESEAIMAWQVCNEPRAFSKAGKEALAEWIQQTARAIKAADPNHLVSTGSEGKYGCEIDLDLWRRIHAMPEIDYAIIHLWPTNWGWASRDSVEQHIDRACELSKRYIDEHVAAMKPYGKPLVIEEFGYPRDGLRFSPESTVKARDKYYDFIYSLYREPDSPVKGVNFWGWAGEGRAEHERWQPGDSFICDPAHEPQGFYCVFDSDKSTIDIIAGRRPTKSPNGKASKGAKRPARHRVR